jgi:hypothetical protein
MSDYLGHLAARSLAPEPIVRPRLLTLFESPRVGASSFFGDKEAVSPADSDPAADSKLDAFRGVSQQPHGASGATNSSANPARCGERSAADRTPKKIKRASASSGADGRSNWISRCGFVLDAASP